MREIRFHGRGGQGVVKSAQLIVQTVVDGGGYAHFIPSFGVERKGSPVYGFLRLSDSDIRFKSQVRNPEALVILDESLLKIPQTLDGLKEGGLIILNSTKTLDELREEEGLPEKYGNIYTVPATEIALKYINLDIPNTAMLGAYAKIIGDIDMELLRKNIVKNFDENNLKAADKAFKLVKKL